MGRLAVVVLLLLAADLVRADSPLAVDASTTLAADRTTLQLVVRNTGTDAVRDVRPAVHHQGVTHDGTPLESLPPGDDHAWTIVLDPPAEPGAIPAIVDVAYLAPDGTRQTVPYVAAVETPGLPPADVTLAFESTPVGRYGSATLTLQNRGAVPIHGRVVLALPSALTTEPVSQAADVAAGQRLVVPVVVQRAGGARPGLESVFAFFDYGLEGRRHVVVSRSIVTISDASGSVSPLVVGGMALALALAALAVAWRIAARRRAAAPA
jgi:hypothetical protein